MLQIHAYLIEKLEMPEALLDALCACSFAQGLMVHSSEAEIAFKHQYARNMLNTAVELFRWYRNRCNALKLLMLQPYLPVHPATGEYRSIKLLALITTTAYVFV